MRWTVLDRARTLLAGIVALVGVLTVTAGAAPLTSTPAPAMAQPPVASIPTVTDWHQIALPLDAYVQDFADRQTVLRAEYALTKACVERFGLEFQAPAWDKSTADVPSGGQPTHYRLYGLLDEDHAEQMGYHSYGQESPDEATYAQRDPAASLLAAGKLGGGTYKGITIPDGGCIGEARREVEGTTDLSLVDRLAADAWTESQRDSRVVAAFAAWSTCMTDAGYNYRTPMAADDDPKWGGEQASAEEIAVAVADVGCKKSTNLAGIRMAVEAAYQRVAMSEHAAELGAIQAAFVRQATTAAVILSKP